MSLSDLFSDKASSRVAAYAFAAVAVLGLEGCVTTGSTQNVMRGAVNGIVTRESYQLRKGMADSLSHATKCAVGVRYCPSDNSQYDQMGTPRRVDPRYGY